MWKTIGITRSLLCPLRCSDQDSSSQKKMGRLAEHSENDPKIYKQESEITIQQPVSKMQRQTDVLFKQQSEYEILLQKLQVIRQ